MNASIPVSLNWQKDGWVLLTVDSGKDVLAGPFTDRIQSEESAKELNLRIVAIHPKIPETIKDCIPETVFKTWEGLWYEVKGRNGAMCRVRKLGETVESEIPRSTKVKEISVLSLK